MAIKTSPNGIRYTEVPKGLHGQYHGCGEAWGAISNKGVLLDFVYMEDAPGVNGRDAEVYPFLALAYVHCNGLDGRMLPTFHGPQSKAAFLDAALAAGLLEERGRMRKTLHMDLRRHLEKDTTRYIQDDNAALVRFQAEAIEKLAAQGTVHSGMLSCYEFCLDVRYISLPGTNKRRRVCV
jgi:hypothetical protein